MNSPLPKKKVEVDFPTALRAVGNGKRIVNPEWKEACYGFMHEGVVSLHKPDGTISVWIISDADLNNEWIII